MGNRDNKISNELKPCPFCGGNDIVVCEEQAQARSWPYWYVWCRDCDVHGPSRMDGEAGAVADWNDRET